MPPQSLPARDSRPYDVLLWGATGFTGGLVAAYLCSANRASARGSLRPLRWAIGGRDEKKLQKVKDALELDASVAEPPAIVVADADDPPALQHMTAQTRVVISTVGPYARYGEPLVAACVKTGTDYCDITGESTWVASMLHRYNDAAARSGALIVNMCGFDSIPADLGAFLLADWMRRERHTATLHMQGYTTMSGGGPSGGTVASIMNLRESPATDADGSGKGLTHAYLLNPPEYQYGHVRPTERDQWFPRYESDINRWTVPFIMAIVNTRVARRSLALRRKLEKDTEGFGPNATYNEAMPAPFGGGFIAALLVWFLLLLGGLGLAFGPTRTVMKWFLPKPGQGPSAAVRARTRFSHRVVGRGADGSVGQAVIAGGDAGYEETARMVSETALLLALERERSPLQVLLARDDPAEVTPPPRIGGFFTPSLVGGHRLVDRLRHAGMRLEVAEFAKIAHKSGAAATSASASSSSKASQQ